MKLLKHIFSITVLSALVVLNTSCRDEAKNPVLAWESALNGFGQFVLPDGSLIPLYTNNNAIGQGTIDRSVFFRANNPQSTVRGKITPISIDGKLEPEQVELYLHFFEPYVDKDGFDQFAQHGGDPTLGTGTKGIKIATLTGVSNRTPVDFSITAAQALDAYKNATFDYGDGRGKVSVFGRRASRGLLPGDTFLISWAIKGKNGLVYSNWSPVYLCSTFSATGGEVLGVNCFLQWSVQ